MLTQKTLKEIAHYDPVTGVFTKKANGATGGNSRGYRVINIDGRQHPIHRLAWLYMTGAWPENVVDHIDLDRSNNAFTNLREATTAQNLRNCRVRSHNKVGLKGVCYDAKENRFRAQISIGGRTKNIGNFKTAAAAHDRYVAVARDLDGEFARAA